MAIPALMRKGSVLLYTGSVFHGGGQNVTDSPRAALNIDYTVGWLRQEENQYLSCPPSIAHTLPRELSALIGYSRENGSLGYFGEGQDPEDALIAAGAGQWASQAAVEGVASVSSRSRQKR